MNLINIFTIITDFLLILHDNICQIRNTRLAGSYAHGIMHFKNVKYHNINNKGLEKLKCQCSDPNGKISVWRSFPV